MRKINSVICLGGGPAGLYFAISMKLRALNCTVVVLERNKANDTFGWGVVLSDGAMDNLMQNDPVTAKTIRDSFVYLGDISVEYKGNRTVSGGHGFAGIGRMEMLVILQNRARELGVELRFETEINQIETYQRDYDLVVAADGINSGVRAHYAEFFQPDIDTRKCKFIWLGTRQKFDDAFTRYQEDRRLEVLRLQSAARNSLEWFEECERHLDFDPVQFTYSLLTRSQRISHENLRLRDPKWLEGAEKWFQSRAGSSTHRAPMFAPYHLREMALKNRIVVSPMAQYMAENGTPTDWHLVHYGERAKGGAWLVYTEMTCVSPNGRITPGCPGLYTPEHVEKWAQIVDFTHQHATAKICCQIGHSGRKGSTQLGWQDIDAPLQSGNWPLLSASAIAWSKNNATPCAITRVEMELICDEFVASAKMAAHAGFDMIELHAAHGYLISSFISPLSNIRDDMYGGTLENRMRYPLEVFRAMRDVWPKGKPMAVRISASDWAADDGVTPMEAVEIARMFSALGADISDVSSGQTSVDAQPVYGRMYQTSFSDRIRNDAKIATMAVGNIYEPDHVNSILMAGRADLVCLARPHLTNPYWTLHAASEIGDRLAD